MSFSVQAEEDSNYKTIADVFISAAKVNQKISALGIDSEDTDKAKQELALKELIKERNQYFQTLLLMIRGSLISFDIKALHKKELRFLHSKININRSRGNLFAVKRDKYLVEQYLAKKELANYVQYLASAGRYYATEEAVLTESNKRLKKAVQKNKEVNKPGNGEGAIYDATVKNYQHLLQTYTISIDFIQFVLDNPEDIVVTSFLQRISIISAISYINSIDALKPANHAISPLKLDMGGVLVALCIFLLTMIAFPVISRVTHYLVEKFILNDDKVEHIEIVLLSIRKPILYWVTFFGLDLAIATLMYKTTYKVSIEQFSYFIYSVLYVYLLFNLIESVATVRLEAADKRNKEYSKELLLLTVKVLKTIVILVALTFILSHMGINVTAIISTLGIGGFAFAMAAKDSLSNFFGGLNIMIDRIFKMGDWIKVGGAEGTVVEIGLRSTTIRTFDNALITMPNSLVSTASVLNWNRRAVGRRIKMHVGVTYESNMQDIKNAVSDIKAMLAEHPEIANPREKQQKGVLRKKNRYLSHADQQGIKSNQLVFLDRYGDFSIDILVYCFSKTVDWTGWLEVKEDVMFQIAEILEQNNLSFAYPTHVQINRDEEAGQAMNNQVLQGEY
ncbi:MAG: mechanosensitive ion channel family protein [Methyloprofundus sp.]|nr:mechanosensitive ion channel family protein [Methyloprofundus sp.]